MGSLVGLDTNIFIYTLEGNTTFGRMAAQLLRAATAGEVAAIASELIYMEVLTGQNIKTRAETARATEFLAGLGVTYRSIDRQILLSAAKLRREHGIRTPDAIHVATALATGATHFVTNDRDLLKKVIPGIKLLALKDVTTTSPQ